MKQFRYIIEDNKGVIHYSNWFDIDKVEIQDITDRYTYLSAKYELICDIQYREEMR